MATTYADLIDAVSALLHSQTADLEQQTWLTQPVTATTQTTLTVDDATQVSRGLIEVDDELMWVKSVDTTANTVTIAPPGRGYRESTAATHAVNALVVNNPRYPRAAIRNAIQEVIPALYPDLYGVKTYEGLSSVSVRTTYQLPADTAHILRVQWATVGPSGRWAPVRRWSFDPAADPTAYSTGKSIDILEPMTPGRTIKIVYAAEPLQFTSDTQTLQQINLDEDHRDILILGAASRLLMYQDAARLQTTNVEQTTRDNVVPPNAGAQAGRGLYAIYKQRVQEESQMLHQSYPTLTHLTR